MKELKKTVMEDNTLLSKLSGKFLTGIIFIVAGILTIIDPGYVKAKWGSDSGWETQLIAGGGFIIAGSIVAIVQGISIYKSYKKEKESNQKNNNGK